MATAQSKFPVASDNCDADVTNIVKNAGQFVANSGCANSGSYTNTWTVTDACSNTSEVFTQVITIEDKTAPIIVTCPATQTVVSNSSCQALVPDFTKNIIVTDNCSAAEALMITQSPAAGSTASSGTTTITVTVKDACGNESKCETKLIVTNFIVANDDAGTPINGYTGGISFTNVLSNDLLDCKAVKAEDVTTSFVSSTNPGITLNGTNVVVAAGTPAGSYSLTYQICEIANPGNCDQANVTVVVNIPKINTINATSFSTSNCESDNVIINLLSNITVNGEPVPIDKITITLSSGNYQNIVLDNLGSISIIKGIPLGTYPITYTVCEKLNPDNCTSGSITIVIEDTTAPVIAQLPSPKTISCDQTPTFANAIATDICSSVTLTYEDTIVQGDCSGSFIITRTWTATNSTGKTTTASQIINVQDITAPVITKCAVNQTIAANSSCQAIVPDFTKNVIATDNCSAAEALMITQSPAAGAIVSSGTTTITITVKDACGNPSTCEAQLIVTNFIVANDDTGNPVNGYTGGISFTNVLSNDLLDCKTINTENVTTSFVSSTNSGITLNGTNVVVAAGTPAGSYSLTYQICEIANPGNCDQANVIVTVTSPIIDAVNDNAGPIDGINGVKNILNVFTNDTLNGAVVNPSEVTLSMVTPDSKGFIALNPDGSVDVKDGTPTGTYTFTYSICEKLNPQNCDTATVTIIVTCDGTKISGIVYNAGSNNSPLANVPITLTPITIVNGQNSITGPGIIQITNAQGYYNYTGMPAGDYVLQVQDANLNVAFDLYNVTTSFLVLKVEKCNYLERNFGYDKNISPVLGDFVWYDVNNNSKQDEWYDANNDGLVTKNIPDANGYVDSTKWLC